jgi:hypothetical protein
MRGDDLKYTLEAVENVNLVICWEQFSQTVLYMRVFIKGEFPILYHWEVANVRNPGPILISE